MYCPPRALRCVLDQILDTLDACLDQALDATCHARDHLSAGEANGVVGSLLIAEHCLARIQKLLAAAATLGTLHRQMHDRSGN